MEPLKDYSIRPVSIKRIKYGKVNRSYLVKTKGGEFILQYLKYDDWMEKQLRTEIKLLNYLNKHNFRYQVPIPIKSKNGKIILRRNGNLIWLYKKVAGHIIDKYKLNEYVQEAEALAEYHNIIERLNTKSKSDSLDFEFTLTKLDEIEKVKPKTELDNVAKKYVTIFKKMIKKIKNMDFDVDFLYTHSDFNNENLLFTGGKLTGIIDFHNVDYAPVSKDIAIAIKRTEYIKYGFNLRKTQIFLKYYRKYRKLSKKEEKLIVPFLLINNATTYWWFYLEYKGGYNEKLEKIKQLIYETKKYGKKWI